jgi:hypothetical protein
MRASIKVSLYGKRRRKRRRAIEDTEIAEKSLESATFVMYAMMVAVLLLS